MHQARTQAIRQLPIPRKGTKYVARAASHVHSGVPVVIAVRDMLKLANTSKEVKKMVNNRVLKVNGKEIKDIKEAIRLFNILEADKSYKLTVLRTGRFAFEETKDDFGLCKVVGKKILEKDKTQLNLHNGRNVISKEKVKVGDSVVLESGGKVKKIIPVEKGKEALVISGKSVGLTGKISDVEGKKVKVNLNDLDKEVVLDTEHIIVR
jgi:small subunit ribosomal protein S4e